MGAQEELLKVAHRELIGEVPSKFLGGLLGKAPMGASRVSYLGAPREALSSSYVQLVGSYL